MLHHRVSSFLNELRTKEYRHVAVFAHGGVLVSAGLYAGLYSEAEAFCHLVAFGGVMEIVI